MTIYTAYNIPYLEETLGVPGVIYTVEAKLTLPITLE